MINQQDCAITSLKLRSAMKIAADVKEEIKNNKVKKMNAIWLETTGCSGNIISFLNGDYPGAFDVLTDLVELTYNNTLMGKEGENAYKSFLDTLETDFILLVDGAISTRENGLCNIVARYEGRWITTLEAVKVASERAKYIVTVGTCASYGGISSARPNPSDCKSVKDVVAKPVIRLPGCPCHPDWVIGTVAYLVGYGMPQLDDDSRPVLFYGLTIHDICTRRGLFDNGIFATKLGEEGCMLNLGCRGPVTKTDCPRRKWNGYVNWPIGTNSTCIGCAQPLFPDGMEPFVQYSGK